MSETSPNHVIWIYQNRSGQLRVFPSPAHVEGGQTVAFKSLSGHTAEVRLPFLDDPIRVPDNRAPSTLVTVPAGDPRYIDYDVIVAGGYYAEGGSPPGLIVDP